MELSFKLADKAKFKTGKFVIENLKIADIIGNSNYQLDNEISYDNIELYLDGNKYDGTIYTWAGTNLSANDIFEQCLNAYIRNDTENYESFSNDWNIFNKTKSLKEYQDDLLIKMPIFELGQFSVYELDLATPKNRYYSCADRCLLMSAEGSVRTDIENFYLDAMYSDICAILKDELRCLYKSENIDRMIKEYGGKEGFLEEFDTNN
jgi:hypothetical protein